MTSSTPLISRPRAATSVATRTSNFPSLKAFRVVCRHRNTSQRAFISMRKLAPDALHVAPTASPAPSSRASLAVRAQLYGCLQDPDAGKSCRLYFKYIAMKQTGRRNGKELYSCLGEESSTAPSVHHRTISYADQPQAHRLQHLHRDRCRDMRNRR